MVKVDHALRETADSIPFALIVGGDEAAEGVAGVKDMATGEQRKLSPADAAAYILSALEARKNCRVIAD